MTSAKSIDELKIKAGRSLAVEGLIDLRRLLERLRVDAEIAGDFFYQPAVVISAPTLYRAAKSPRLNLELLCQPLLGVYPMLEHQYSELSLVDHRKSAIKLPWSWF